MHFVAGWPFGQPSFIHQFVRTSFLIGDTSPNIRNDIFFMKKSLSSCFERKDSHMTCRQRLALNVSLLPVGHRGTKKRFDGMKRKLQSRVNFNGAHTPKASPHLFNLPALQSAR
jgi:hypothetical protein